MLRRFKILGIGLILGAIFAFFIAGPMMPSGMNLEERVFVWISVMGGPIEGTVYNMVEFHPSIGLGWLGIFLIPAHPLRPNAVSGCATILGFSLWFFSGFLTMVISVWGA